MLDRETCREHILSEDYRDFIGNHVRTPFFNSLMTVERCEQDAGFSYKCFYLPKEITDPITFPKYSYTSIPNCYTPLSMQTLNEAGILPIQNYPTLQLKGRNILIGFLDSGIDYTNPVFRNLDNTTRIRAIWDQTVQTGNLPEHFSYGSEFTEDQINEALRSDSPFDLVPSTDETGHGTYAAALACGSAIPEEEFLGAAPEASIAVVKLKQAKKYLRDYYFIPTNAVCYQETDLMLGLRYLNLLADSLNLPLVICFTVGSNMGGHIGTLPLPQLIENYGTLANHIIVIGTGNEADQRHHYSNLLTNGTENKTVEIRVGENVSGFSMELWTDIPNVLSISIISLRGKIRPESLSRQEPAQRSTSCLNVQKYPLIIASSLKKVPLNLYFSDLTVLPQVFGRSSSNLSSSPTVNFICGFRSQNLLTVKCIFSNLTPTIL